MGPHSLLSYQVNLARGCLFVSVLFVLSAGCLARLVLVFLPCFLRLRPQLAVLLPSIFASPVSLPHPPPSLAPLAPLQMLVCLVCAAACGLLPFLTPSRPPPFRSSPLRVPMVMPYSRRSSLPVPVLCVRSPSSSLVRLVSSRFTWSPLTG